MTLGVKETTFTSLMENRPDLCEARRHDPKQEAV